MKFRLLLLIGLAALLGAAGVKFAMNTGPVGKIVSHDNSRSVDTPSNPANTVTMVRLEMNPLRTVEAFISMSRRREDFSELVTAIPKAFNECPPDAVTDCFRDKFDQKSDGGEEITLGEPVVPETPTEVAAEIVNGAELKVTSFRANSTEAVVDVKFRSSKPGSKTYPCDFYLYKVDGRWRIFHMNLFDTNSFWGQIYPKRSPELST